MPKIIQLNLILNGDEKETDEFLLKEASLLSDEIMSDSRLLIDKVEGLILDSYDFLLSPNEVKALIFFINSMGYIGHEFHSEIHELYKKLIEYDKLGDKK